VANYNVTALLKNKLHYQENSLLCRLAAALADIIPSPLLLDNWSYGNQVG